jgi:calcineurin-like phosphoesterase family protein
MSDVWFTSDTHFFHKNIIEFCQRPYKDVDEMNWGMVAIWNDVVKPHDTVFHLGDLSFGNLSQTISILSSLNGHLKIVPGNHDPSLLLKDLEAVRLIKEMPAHMELKRNGQRAVLCHFPMGSWHSMQGGSWMLHGHCHGGYKHGYGKILDVGWDVHHRPISWAEIKDIMDSKEFIQVDEHRPRS